MKENCLFLEKAEYSHNCKLNDLKKYRSGLIEENYKLTKDLESIKKNISRVSCEIISISLSIEETCKT